MLMAKTGRPWESMIGSGQFGTPCERMQAEYATADGDLVDPPAPGEPPEPENGGLLLAHAATSRVRTPVAMRAAAVRPAGGRRRRGRRVTRVRSSIMASLGAGSWL